MIFAHGAQYQGVLKELAPEFPKIMGTTALVSGASQYYRL